MAHSPTLRRLVQSSSDLEMSERETTRLRAARDSDLRAALEAGDSWDAIQAATGIARSTIAKAKNRT